MACVVVFAAFFVGSAAAGGERRIATTKAPSIVFNPPGQLPAARVGDSYAYSFCRPRPMNGRCGGARTTSPSGGLGKQYVFTLKPGSRLPSGLHLRGRSGVLSGTVSEEARPGAYALTVCVTDAERNPNAADPSCAATRLSVRRAAAAGDFALAAARGALAVTAGGAPAVAAIDVTRRNGFAGDVTFSVLSAPTGVTVAFTPTATGANANVSAALTAPLGAVTVTIAGASGSRRQTVALTLAIAAPPARTTDFAGHWNGNFQALVTAGNCQATANGTVQLALAQGGVAVAINVTWNVGVFNLTSGTVQACGPLAAFDGAFAAGCAVDGDACTGGGFLLRKQTENAIDGQFIGVVGGVNANATFTLFRG